MASYLTKEDAGKILLEQGGGLLLENSVSSGVYEPKYTDPSNSYIAKYTTPSNTYTAKHTDPTTIYIPKYT